MDSMTLTYVNKCIDVFSKIYQTFGKISAVGLVIISAIFCLIVLCVIGLVPVKLGIFLSRGKRQLKSFASQNKTAWEFCVMWINNNICIKLSMLFYL